MAKIFFGCSMRGGYANVSREDVAKIQSSIVEIGHELTTKHQTKEGIIGKENNLAKKEIHDRDYKWLMESDIGIFEISNASLGVGGEIADMIHMKKPVLCLFKKGLKDNVSAYIQGKKGSEFVKAVFECEEYEGLDDAKEKIKNFIESNS
jgi:nucleoside 2-deoxyribosyltransferase